MMARSLAIGVCEPPASGGVPVTDGFGVECVAVSPVSVKPEGPLAQVIE